MNWVNASSLIQSSSGEFSERVRTRCRSTSIGASRKIEPRFRSKGGCRLSGNLPISTVPEPAIKDDICAEDKIPFSDTPDEIGNTVEERFKLLGGRRSAKKLNHPLVIAVSDRLMRLFEFPGKDSFARTRSATEDV